MIFIWKIAKTKKCFTNENDESQNQMVGWLTASHSRRILQIGQMNRFLFFWFFGIVAYLKDNL